MSKSTPAQHARRALIWLVVLFLVLTGVLAAGNLIPAMRGEETDAQWTPKLGLDLEGGTQMILAPRVSSGEEIDEDQLKQAVEIIRQRVDGSGVSESEIRTQGSQNVIVNLPGVPDDQTRNLIRASANMQFRPVLQSAPGQGGPVEREEGADVEMPVSVDPPEPQPTDATDQRWITDELKKQYENLDCTDLTMVETLREISEPDRAIVSCEMSTNSKYILGPQEIPGTDIAEASSGQMVSSNGAVTNTWAVNIQFNDSGSREFKKITERGFPFNAGANQPADPRNQFAIVLDGLTLSAPTINAVIADGRAQITGNFTEESAKALSDQLRYGALPVSFSIESENQISPTLGTEQLRSGLIAGLIGLILVAIYSLFQYRLLGLVTFASLIVAGVLTYLAIAILGWTENYRLTLAGVAGLIVAIGLTADSFIVYFERIRDEIREGRSLISAVETGWQRARRTILASKAVNLLGAVVLYYVAVGNVQGFAFTLGLTAIADLVVVFLFTHPVLQLLARTKFFGGGHRLSGLDPATLGVTPSYRGAGRFRSPEETLSKAHNVPKSNRGSTKEAERRLSIAERRKQEAGNNARGEK